MASVQDVLLLKAVQDAESLPSGPEAFLYGGGAGAAAGAYIGNQALQGKNAVNSMIDRIAASRGLTPAPSGLSRILKPGPRMSGGLIGLILGGGLGSGLRQMAINESPAAELLAKIQTGTFTAADKNKLQVVLADTYKQMGIV